MSKEKHPAYTKQSPEKVKDKYKKMFPNRNDTLLCLKAAVHVKDDRKNHTSNNINNDKKKK
jgi:hypothetical protein